MLIILLWLKKFKVNDSVRIIKYKNIFGQGYTENLSIKVFIVNSTLKTNLWTYTEKNKSFCEKELLLSKL